MGISNHYHHHRQIISSFNPACCLRPPTVKKGTPRRGCDVYYDDDDDDVKCSSYSAALMAVADEPSSPKVGCMGQIKRGKADSMPTAARGHRKLYKFRRMLSGGSMRRSLRASSRVGDDRSTTRVSVAEMDPPLPVVRGARTGAKPVSLWRRRCGGRALEGLQLQRQDSEVWGSNEGPRLRGKRRSPTLVLQLS